MQVTVPDALAQLEKAKSLFTTVFTHGSLVVEIYRPQIQDLQQPHSRDEVYFIISGTGDFFCDGQTTPFQPGDFLFVAAGKEHRFVNFTNDFVTWVLFYGSEGGER